MDYSGKTALLFEDNKVVLPIRPWIDALPPTRSAAPVRTVDDPHLARWLHRAEELL